MLQIGGIHRPKSVRVLSTHTSPRSMERSRSPRAVQPPAMPSNTTWCDWEWQAMDGAMTKAPLGKEQTGPNPTDRAKRGVKRSLLVEGNGVPQGIWLYLTHSPQE